MRLELLTAAVTAGDRHSLIEALRTLSDYDNDFNGENGLEYLKEEVWEANGYIDKEEFEEKYFKDKELTLRYESNQDFYLEKMEEADDVSDEEIVRRFIFLWLGHDSYYKEYKVQCLASAGDVYAISLAIVED